MKKITLIQHNTTNGKKVRIIVERTWGTSPHVIQNEEGEFRTERFKDEYSLFVTIDGVVYSDVSIEKDAMAPAGKVLRLDYYTSLGLPVEKWEELEVAISERLNNELPPYILERIQKAKECEAAGHVLPKADLEKKLAEDWEIKEDDLMSLFSPYSSWMSSEEIEKLKVVYPSNFINARESVGRQIREARTKAGLSLRELADKCGIAFNHIGRIEKGKYNVSIDTLERIAKALNCSITIA